MTSPVAAQIRLAWRALAFLLVAAAAGAILSTARTFSGTVDEPAHIAAGLQWLSTNRYDYDLQHPPLGRALVAIGPYLAGARSTGASQVFDEGARILGSGQHYVDTLASARHGAIVAFLLLALVVWNWAHRELSPAGAAIATLLVVTNPIVLAHAGLATTDMACAATTTLALFAGTWWLDDPTWRRSLLLGAASGVAIGSRLSAIAFVGAALAGAFALHGWATRRWFGANSARPRDLFASLGLVLIACLVVIWAAYKFTVGPMRGGGPTVPAPAFVAGMSDFFLHGSTGHPTFLLGTPSNRGWWYYFPVALLVKTPLPLLLLTIAGGATVTRRLHRDRDWRGAIPLASAVVMLLVSMAVRVDLGVRLILPVFPLLAIVAAQGALEIWRQSASRINRVVIVALLIWAPCIAVRAHPDHLAYFNALAGDHPENVLVDSNLDWGQDLYRLRDTLLARGIHDSVLVAYFGTADLQAAGVPRSRVLGLHERATGWIAASETYLAGEWVGHAYQWLLEYPTVTHIGPSMRLWYVPPGPAMATSPR